MTQGRASGIPPCQQQRAACDSRHRQPLRHTCKFKPFGQARRQGEEIIMLKHLQAMRCCTECSLLPRSMQALPHCAAVPCCVLVLTACITLCKADLQMVASCRRTKGREGQREAVQGAGTINGALAARVGITNQAFVGQSNRTCTEDAASVLQKKPLWRSTVSLHSQVPAQVRACSSLERPRCNLCAPACPAGLLGCATRGHAAPAQQGRTSFLVGSRSSSRLACRMDVSMRESRRPSATCTICNGGRGVRPAAVGRTAPHGPVWISSGTGGARAWH